MTTITLPRATVEQALSLCESVHGLRTDDEDGSTVWCPEVIDSLRSALAQAEPVEPVAWQCREHGDSEWFDCGKESYGINPRRYTYRTLYTAPPQRKPLTVTKMPPRKLPEGNDD